MMKLLKILFIAAFLFIGFQTPSHAADIRDSLVIQEDEKQIGDVELQYNKYPISRYSIDTKIPEQEWSDFLPSGWDEAASKSLWQLLSYINSMIWVFLSTIGMWTGKIVEMAFTLDVINAIVEKIDLWIGYITGIDSTGFNSDGLFTILARYFLLALGLWMLWQMMVHKSTASAFGGLIKTFIILSLSVAYILNAGPILKGVNEVSNSISQTLLAKSSMITDPSSDYSREEGYANMRNSIFNTMVYQPWLIAEFGTTDVEEIESEYKKSGSRIHDLLKTKDFTKERSKQITYEVEKQENTNMQPDALPIRFVVLVLSLMTNLVMAAFLFFVSGAAIAFQFLAILFALTGPFALLVSLFPGYAGNAATWVAKFINPFLMKIGFCFFLTVIFTFQTLINDLMGNNTGFFFLMIIKIIMISVIWIKREEILSVIIRPTRRAGISATAFTSPARYKSLYNKGKGYVNRVTHPFTKKAKPEHEKASYKIRNNPGVGASERNHRAYNMSYKTGSGSVNRNAPAPVENKTSTNRTGSTTAASNNQKPAHANTSVSRTDQQPPQLTKEDLNSLDRTTKKGGWGYQATDKPSSNNESVGDFRKVKQEPVKNNVVDRMEGKKNVK